MPPGNSDASLVAAMASTTASSVSSLESKLTPTVNGALRAVKIKQGNVRKKDRPMPETSSELI